MCVCFLFYSTENPRKSANKRSTRYVWHVRLGTQRRSRDEGEKMDLRPLFFSVHYASQSRFIRRLLKIIYGILLSERYV